MKIIKGQKCEFLHHSFFYSPNFSFFSFLFPFFISPQERTKKMTAHPSSAIVLEKKPISYQTLLLGAGMH